MKQFALLILSLLFLTGCTDRDDDLSGGVFIRIKNESDLIFDQVQVGAADKLHHNIPPGAFSDYLEYGEVYSYAYINITVGDENFDFQPTDYVGEDLLEQGFYTYVLNVSEEETLRFNFIVD